jgi:uncharacterized protein (TIGR04255 family)
MVIVAVETFKNAPITEALIDIRAELDTSIQLSNLETLQKDVANQYPKTKLRQRFEGSIEFKSQTPPLAQTKSLGPDGYLLWSEDEKQVVQYRLDGFTFSRLRPYRDWDTMSSQARQLWDLYVSRIKPVRATRIALRYINLIEIPTKSFILEDYFNSTPKIPEGLPQTLEEFLSRIVISISEFDARAVVTFTTQPSKNPTVSAILFDIDVFRHVQLAPESPAIWDILSGLRGIKNDIFFKYVTEKTKELFR